MQDSITPEALEALSKKATQGVWRYRPDEHDDWGIVKSPVLPDGFACVLAQFRDPDALDNETLARHRETKTDPWEANARFVVALVNLYRTGQLILAQPSGDEVEAARKFNLGDRVTKTKGSSWTGLVVGFYSTSLTPIGCAVESENEPGSVQIYPESALEACLKARENSDG